MRDVAFIICPAIVFGPEVSSFDAAGSTETGVAMFSGLSSKPTVRLQPVIQGTDIALVPPELAENIAYGWEKGAPMGSLGVTGPCLSGACASMGTAAFVLSGSAGTISIGGIGLPGGTYISDISDGTYTEIAGNTALVNLGSFRIIPNPEPSTGLLLAFGLIGIAAGRRRRAAAH